MMRTEQTFLIKYGIHNFVKFSAENDGNTFYIRKTERDTMINHAKSLIEDSFGNKAKIRVI